MGRWVAADMKVGGCVGRRQTVWPNYGEELLVGACYSRGCNAEGQRSWGGRLAHRGGGGGLEADRNCSNSPEDFLHDIVEHSLALTIYNSVPIMRII